MVDLPARQHNARAPIVYRPSSAKGQIDVVRDGDRGDDPLVAALRRDFLVKMSHDKAAVERIVNGLRKKHPEEPLASIYERAIPDWLNDNNRS